jgi:hypothetical protein
MAILEAGSRLDNISKSINAFVRQEITTELAYPVYYMGQDRLGALPIRWVEADFIPASAIDMVMAAPGGGLSTWTECFLNMNCFEQTETGIGTSNLYSLITMVETIRQKFLVTTAIPVRDYGTSGNPQVAVLMVWERPSVTEVPIVPDAGIKQTNISVPMRYHEITQLS